MTSTTEDTVAQLRAATEGFDHLFRNDLVGARAVFAADPHPFRLMGLGVCAFMEAALGMETGLMAEASRCLTAAEAGAKKQAKAMKSAKPTGQFPPGLEWEILLADTVILNGMTSALSESYMGYLQCIYAMNSAHTKFSKLFKTVFPAGLDEKTAASRVPSRKPSTTSLAVTSTSGSITPPEPSPSGASTPKRGFFGGWGAGKTLAVPRMEATKSAENLVPDGPLDELVVSGVAFGYGLFNLIFSLLPAKARGFVGFFGFQHDRKLALRALAFSAESNDVHSSLSGLALMTYHGVVLLLAGWQADEARIIKQYTDIVEKLTAKYPTGSLWILNRAKLQRMQGDADMAIKTLQDGLSPDRPQSFVQADALLVFELAWTLLSQRRYQESADAFIKITTINSWSQSTYYFIAAGCYISLGNYEKAQELLDQVPALLEKKKLSGKDLPTEVFIKKRMVFYKQKQMRRTGSEEGWIQSIKVNPAEELALFWNTHARITPSIAEAHIHILLALSPAVTIATPLMPAPPPASAAAPGAHLDLDTPDELAARAVLLGITHRAAGHNGPARAFLEHAHALQSELVMNTWVGGIAMYELAVLDLHEASARGDATSSAWAPVLSGATEKLDKALALAGSSVDLSSRLDSRIAMLKDEMAVKRETLGIPA